MSTASTDSTDDNELATLIDRLSSLVADGRDSEVEKMLQEQHAHSSTLTRARALLRVLKRAPTDRPELLSNPIISQMILGNKNELGDFKLHREIGRGGMGVVFEATQISLNRKIALKILPYAAIVGELRLQRFLNEARAAAGLHHPNIVPVFAVGHESGVHYYAMQLIQGRSMAEIIRSALQDKSNISWKTICMWGVQIANALEHAHAVGIVHRDIKPANLLVQEDGKVFVTDFGLAQFDGNSDLTLTGEIVGTAQYLSPEQAQGIKGNINHRADIYSLGATLYELATLRPIVSGSNRVEVLRRILDQDPTSPCKLRPELPTELETILLKATYKDPADRYNSAQDIANDLQRLLDDKPILARRRAWSRRIQSWVSHNTIAARMFLACVLAVGILGAVFVYSRQQRNYALAIELSRQNRRHLELLEYGNCIQSASLAIQRGDYGMAEDYLRRCIPEPNTTDYRSFEWYYLDSCVKSRARRIGKHDGDAYSLALASNGKWLASCGKDGARIWDRYTREQIWQIDDHNGDVNCVSFSDDCSRLLTSGDDGEVNIFSTDDWTLLQTIKHVGAVVAARFAANDAYIVTAERHFDSPSEKGVRIGSDQVRVWNATDGSHAFDAMSHSDAIQSLAVSPNGRWIGTGGSDGYAIVWDIQDRREIGRFSHKTNVFDISQRSTIHCVAFANRNPLLATVGSEGTIGIWTVGSDETVHDRKQAPFGLQSVCFTDDDTELLTAGDGNSVLVWDLQFHKSTSPNARFTDITHAWCVCAQGGTLYWSNILGEIVESLLRFPEGRTRTRTPYGQSPAICATDLGLVTSYGTDIHMYGYVDGELIRRWPTGFASAPKLIAVDDRKEILAVVLENNDCFLEEQPWNGSRRRKLAVGFPISQIQFIDRLGIFEVRGSQENQVLQCSLSSNDAGQPNVFEAVDNRRFIDPYRDAEIKVLNNSLQAIRNNTKLWEREFVGEHLKDCKYCRRSQYVAAQFDKSLIRILDFSTGRTVAEFYQGDAVIFSISPDGQTLCGLIRPKSNENRNEELEFWQVETGRRLFDSPINAGGVTDIQFSPDGKSLIVSGPTARTVLR